MYSKIRIVVILAVFCSVSILFFNNSPCQEKLKGLKQGGGMGYSMFGRSTINLDDLNARLQSQGYSSLADNFFSVGGGGHAIINNRLIIGGEGHSLLGEEVTSGNYERSINIGYGFFDIGYIVYSVQELRIYPLLGIGAGGMNLKIAEDVSSLSFDNALASPIRRVELTTGGFLLNLSVGMDYLIKFSEDKKGKAGMVLGFRAGYTFSPFMGGWTMDELEISGAPELGITGPYIRFMIGGGGIGKQE